MGLLPCGGFKVFLSTSIAAQNFFRLEHSPPTLPQIQGTCVTLCVFRFLHEYQRRLEISPANFVAVHVVGQSERQLSPRTPRINKKRAGNERFSSRPFRLLIHQRAACVHRAFILTRRLGINRPFHVFIVLAFSTFMFPFQTCTKSQQSSFSN